MRFGIAALPIAILLSATIGLMLAIQSLYSLGLFGAQNFAYIGIAPRVTREFSPLIMGILIAGRSGSAIAARLATMTINQEIDALQVMGINPVRFLVAPMLIALVVMLPCLAMLANLVSIGAAGLYVSLELDKSLGSYIYDTLKILTRGRRLARHHQVLVLRPADRPDRRDERRQRQPAAPKASAASPPARWCRRSPPSSCPTWSSAT